MTRPSPTGIAINSHSATRARKASRLLADENGDHHRVFRLEQHRRDGLDIGVHRLHGLTGGTVQHLGGVHSLSMCSSGTLR